MWLDDVEPVGDGLALDSYAVIGTIVGVPEAIAVAARNLGRLPRVALEIPIQLTTRCGGSDQK